MKDVDAVELCTRRMKYPDETVRAAAATALARIGIGNLEASASTRSPTRHSRCASRASSSSAAAHRDDELAALADDADPLVGVTAAMAGQDVPSGPRRQAARARIPGAPEWTVRAGAANLAVSALGREAGLAYGSAFAKIGELQVRVRRAFACGAKPGRRGRRTRDFSSALESPQGIDKAAADLAAQGDATGLAALSADVRNPPATHRSSAPRQRRRIAPPITSPPGSSRRWPIPNGLVRVEAVATVGALAK